MAPSFISVRTWRRKRRGKRSKERSDLLGKETLRDIDTITQIKVNERDHEGARKVNRRDMKEIRIKIKIKGLKKSDEEGANDIKNQRDEIEVKKL